MAQQACRDPPIGFQDPAAKGGWLLALTPEVLHTSSHHTHIPYMVGLGLSIQPPLFCSFVHPPCFLHFGCVCMLFFRGHSHSACSQASLPRTPPSLSLGWCRYRFSRTAGFRGGFCPPVHLRRTDRSGLLVLLEICELLPTVPKTLILPLFMEKAGHL